MKLKIYMSQVDMLKNTFGAIVSLRKECVLRFTSTHLNIISASKNEPQVWSKIPKDVFDLYEVESIRNNVISLELNIEQLYHVFKNFEKSNSDQLAIRLQKTTNESGKSYTRLAIFFNDNLSASSTVNHTFSIAVRLLRKESDERLREPELSTIDVLMKLPFDINFFFKRIERYKSLKYLKIIGTNTGQLSVHIEKASDSNVTLTWNELLQTKQSTESQGTDESHEVKVKLKDWNIGSKICEICKSMLLIICENEALVLHSFMDDNETCEIIYFINAIND